MKSELTYNHTEKEITIIFHELDLSMFRMPEVFDNFWNDIINNKNDVEKIIFDLAYVDYLDSPTIGFIVRVNTKMTPKGIKVVLINISNDLTSIMENFRLLQDFAIE